MDFYDAINRRRSIRQFEDRTVGQEILERIMNAGLKAPSSNHQRRWELVALTDRVRILELAKHIRPYPCRIQTPKSPQQEMFKIAYPRQRTMIVEVVCADDTVPQTATGILHELMKASGISLNRVH